MKRIYFKSFRKGDTSLETSTFNPTKNMALPCQTLSDILRQKSMKPNTYHHTLPNRLSVSCVTTDFPGSYRPEGVLFTTDQSPVYCAPFDLMALTNGGTLTAQDHDSDFLQGHSQFIFSDFESMSNVFPTSDHALDALNKFRGNNGLNTLSQKMDYNEICFEEDVKFKPVALVGVSPEIKRLSLDNKLARYESIYSYLLHINHPIRHPIKKWRELVSLGLGSMFDGYQGLAQERECAFA